jgi:hypothetical protein
MKKIITIIFYILSITSFSQPPTEFKYPGGDTIIVYPDGAYVPNEWINKAVDSTGVWREGTAKFYIALQRISSQQKEINLLEEKYKIYKINCDRIIEEANNKILISQQKNTDLSSKISKLKPWATIGKISTITVSAGVLIGAIVIIQNEIK